MTAVTFALMAAVLLGFVGLSTEAAGWFLIRGAAQAAADGAAVAAVLAINTGGDGAAAASDAMTRNGFTTAELQMSVGTPDAHGPVVTTNVTVTVPPVIAGLLSSAFDVPQIPIRARAVAGMTPIGTACVLSTSGDLTIGQQQNGNYCAYASNALDARAIDVANAVAGQVNVYGFVTSGDCSGCPPPTNPLFVMRPVSTFQPPVIDPYQSALAGVTLPTVAAVAAKTVSCLAPGDTGYQLVPATGNSTTPLTAGTQFYAYCADVSIPPNTAVLLTPGVYFFLDAALTVADGVTMQCTMNGAPNGTPCSAGPTGVTMIFTGSKPADTMPTVKVSPTARINLGPASATDLTPVFGARAATVASYGLLFWRDETMPSGTAAAPAVDIQIDTGASPDVAISGLLYFPKAAVSYGANWTASGGCTTLLAGTISLANQPSQFTDCKNLGYLTPQVLTARVQWIPE